MIIDPSRHLIILQTNTTSATELYSRSVDWLASDDNSKYNSIFRIAGGDDLGGGLSIPPYFFLQNSWRIKPMEANQTLTVTGNLFVESGGDPIVSTDGVFQVLIKSVVPVLAQGISTTGGSGASAADVWAYNNRSLTGLPAYNGPSVTDIRNELTNFGSLSVSQNNMLLEMYNLLGLDPSKPLIVTENSRTAGEINQQIISTPSETIVTRV